MITKGYNIHHQFMIISKKKHEELLAAEIKKTQEMIVLNKNLDKIWDITDRWRRKKIGNYRAISEIHQLLSRLFIEKGQEDGRITEAS